jgi:uncharacterized protein (TIGR03437 family)
MSNGAMAVCLAAAASWVAPALRAQSANYTITTVAGDHTLGYGFSGDGAAAIAQNGNPGAQFWNPVGLAVDSKLNLYIADQYNHRVRQVNSSGAVTTAAGSGAFGLAGDGGLSTLAALAFPCGLAVDSGGNVYIGDTGNSLIRKIATSGTISTLVGNDTSASNASGFTGDGGLATSAELNHPCGVAVDSAGNLFIADTANHRIRRVDAGTADISTVAGSGTAGFAGDGGPALGASFNFPMGIALDASGSNLYIADSLNHAIRKLSLSAGIVTTVAGVGGVQGSGGDGGLAIQANLRYPSDVAVDSAGNVFIADTDNSRIRRVDGVTGVITTIAGGQYGYSGDGGPATSAALKYPAGLTLAPGGLIYVADTQNDVVRLLTPPANAGTPPSIAPGGAITASDFGALHSVAPGTWVEIYGTNLAASTASWDYSTFAGYLGPTSLAGTSVTVGGQAAYTGYVSPGQVNVQLPLTLATGTQYLTVATASGTSAAYAIAVDASQAGLWAPSLLQAGGKRYAGALLADGTFALPAGAVPGISSRPAKPGEAVTLYGVGFGPVNPAISAGRIALVDNLLNSQLKVYIGGSQAALTYAGLAVGSVGLYQITFNVPPNIAAGAAVPLTFTLNGVSGAQTLYLAVGN